MRLLHPVQAHERFRASGRYRFFKNGDELDKHESWTMHQLGDQSRFIRVDHDARAGEGKSILAELLVGADDRLLRFDIRYENSQFDGGIKTLQATYQFADDTLQVGYNLNGAERRYLERELTIGALVDLPLLIARGAVLRALSAVGEGAAMPVFVPMFEHAQLFPGALRLVRSPVEFLGEAPLLVAGKGRVTRRFRYLDKALSYWVDKHGVVVKRINAFRTDEFLVTISDYAQSAD